MNNSGIYKIENLINGKIYVGQSVDLSKRKNEHFRQLKSHTHYNEHLQRSFNRHGLENFTFTILELCDINSLTRKEIKWINYFNSTCNKYGYNITTPHNNGERFTMSDEQRKKLSEVKRVFSSDDLISYLQEYYYHVGKVPSIREISAYKETHEIPSSTCFIEYFGSFKEALIHADIYDFLEDKTMFERKEWTLEVVVEGLRKYYSEHGNTPTIKTNVDYLPSYSTINRMIGHKKEIEKIVGHDPSKLKENEDKKILNQLFNLYLEFGKIDRYIIAKEKRTRSVSALKNRFGSLNKAIELSGITEHMKQSKREKTLQITQDIFNKHGKVSQVLMRENGVDLHYILEKFGSLTKLCALLGIYKREVGRKVV